jgi:WD40 repeat protein
MAVAQWDGTISVWQLACNQTMMGQKPTGQGNQMAVQKVAAAVLGMSWQLDAMGILIACADNNIYKWDLGSNQVGPIASHAHPVKDVFSVVDPKTKNTFVVSGGWDARVKFWSWQGPMQLQQVGEAYVAMPVHYMSYQWPLLVTAH